MDEFEKEFRSIKTVVDIHELHVWALSETEKAVMIHLVTNGVEDKTVYKAAVDICLKNTIHFYTVQIESKSNICPLGLNA